MGYAIWQAKSTIEAYRATLQLRLADSPAVIQYMCTAARQTLDLTPESPLLQIFHPKQGQKPTRDEYRDMLNLLLGLVLDFASMSKDVFDAETDVLKQTFGDNGEGWAHTFSEEVRPLLDVMVPPRGTPRQLLAPNCPDEQLRLPFVFFAHYGQMREAAVHYFERERGLRVAHIHGQDDKGPDGPEDETAADALKREAEAAADMNRRDGLVREFQQGSYDVLVCSTVVGSAGLNFTAAADALNYPCHSNPAVAQQAAGRTNRHGQKEAVTRFFYVFGSVSPVADRFNCSMLKLELLLEWNQLFEEVRAQTLNMKTLSARLRPLLAATVVTDKRLFDRRPAKEDIEGDAMLRWRPCVLSRDASPARLARWAERMATPEHADRPISNLYKMVVKGAPRGPISLDQGPQ